MDSQRVRADFPILQQQVHGKPLVYLDNAVSSQKPQVVIDSVRHLYETSYSNVHRGVHALSQRASELYEHSREVVQQFLNAKRLQEIIFVRGATEAINLVAECFVKPDVGPGDEILVSELEHHANIVPWQQVCAQTGAQLRVVPMNDLGEITLEAFEQALTSKTKFVAINYVSNALGTINPVADFVRLAHAQGVPILLDGAQAVPHLAVDVQALECDFFVFSGHKVFAPSGTGVLYGQQEHLERMPVYQTGGEMILKVTFEKTTFNALPYKFEAGTPNIEGTVGLGVALDYIRGIGLQAIAAYEHELLHYAEEALSTVPGLRIIGCAKQKAALISFVIAGMHAHDLGTIVDQQGVAIRTGHHCAMPAIAHFKVAATARASFAFYNTRDDVDRLVAALVYAREVFGL